MDQAVVRRLNRNVVVGIVYGTEGSAMHNTHSVIHHIYIGDSRDEIERAFAEEMGITGSIEEYLNESWSSITYYDEQAEVETERQKVRDSQPDLPTRVRVVTPVLCVNDYGKLRIRTAPNTTYTVSPLDLNVSTFNQEGAMLEAGTEFIVPYRLAKFLTNSESKAFELVE